MIDYRAEQNSTTISPFSTVATVRPTIDCRTVHVQVHFHSLHHPVVIRVHRECHDEGEVPQDEHEPEEGGVEVVAEHLHHQGQPDHREHVVRARGDVRVAELERLSFSCCECNAKIFLICCTKYFLFLDTCVFGIILL